MAQSNKPEETLQPAGVRRRDIFHIIGSVPALAAVSGTAIAQEHNHAAHTHTAAAPAGPYKRQTFSDPQWRTVGVLADLIIPADERSGSATQAGVPEFIDDWIAFRKSEDGNDFLEAQIFGGLQWLDQEAIRLTDKEFAAAGVENQKKILDRVAWPARAAAEDAPWVQFFNRFRDLTVSGFFSSKMGVHDLPYLGNTAVAEWKGCNPKVWAIIEDRMKNGYQGLGGEVKPGLLS